jgi:excisionase family DNA binding protein
MEEMKVIPEDLIYVEDIIKMFGNKITRNIIYAWIREKKLPALKVGRRYVFSRKRVESFMVKKLGLAS